MKLYDIRDDPNPFGHLTQPEEIDSAELIEELDENATTDKIEIMPEFAQAIEEERRKSIIAALGVAIDAMIISGVDVKMTGIIMSCAVELLRQRQIFDLKEF